MNWATLSQSTTDELIQWAATQDWCLAMAACLQDSQWHSEGDVWTHTQMVLQQLPKLDTWDDLNSDQQRLLTFTALLHDVGKPITTERDPETGRVRSPKHAIKGEQLARQILRDLGCDLLTREAVCRLVRYHGRPPFLMERTDPVQEVVRLSLLLENRLLYLFAIADTRGRDTESMDRPEEDLHYWKLLSEEHQCYAAAYRFATDHARFQYLNQDAPDLHYVPHDDFRCTVMLMSGLPGSGKDTWIAENAGDLPSVSLDQIRREMKVEPTDNQGVVAQAAKEICRQHLRQREDFVFNATNLQRSTRARWLRLFAEYGARIRVIYLEPPLSAVLSQNRQRKERVPEQVIRRLADRVEPPTVWEAHQVRYFS